MRDVLATHILKQTGSYEQASYAIQDTPDMVAQHYGRFIIEELIEHPDDLIADWRQALDG